MNVVDKKNKDTYDYMGKNSKKDTDKLKDMKVKLEEGKVVKAPILVDCPVNIECTVVDSIVTGSHEMFIGKVEYVHANSDLMNEDGDIDFSKINFI